MSRCATRQRQWKKNTILLHCWISYCRGILNGIRIAVAYNGTNRKLTNKQCFIVVIRKSNNWCSSQMDLTVSYSHWLYLFFFRTDIQLSLQWKPVDGALHAKRIINMTKKVDPSSLFSACSLIYVNLQFLLISHTFLTIFGCCMLLWGHYLLAIVWERWIISSEEVHW